MTTTIGVLFTFTANTIIRSSQVNSNFTDIKTAHNTHAAATTSEHGVTGTIVGTSDSQTLTNKSITLAGKSTSNTVAAASGGGQPGATALTADVNRISTCAASGDSVVLLTTFAVGLEQTVINDGAFDCAVYPASGDYIDSLAQDAPYFLRAGGRVVFVATEANARWRTKSEKSGGTIGITAYSGGGQANAVQLVNEYNVITTCAAQGDSVKLPPIFNIGDSIEVVNKGAKTAYIYPASGDSIDSLSANASIPLLPNCSVTLTGLTANSNWGLVDGFRQTSIWYDQAANGTGGSTLASIVQWKYRFLYETLTGFKAIQHFGTVTVAASSRTGISLAINNIVYSNITGNQATCAAQRDTGGASVIGLAVINTSRYDLVHGTATTAIYSWSTEELTLDSQTVL